MIDDLIREVLATHGHLAVDARNLGAETDLYAAGLTSHASVNVMLALEDSFEIEFPEQMLRKSTFSSIAMIRESLDDLGAEVAS
jgi:acyl carrier protein